MLHIGTVVMGVGELTRAIAFWCEALRYQPKRPVRDDDDFMILVPVDGAGAHLALDVSSSEAPLEPRVHLDLFTRDAAEQAAEIERLIGLGATRVDWPHYPADPDFVVLADTEGNRFCIIDTSH